MTLVAQPVSAIYTGTGSTGPFAVPFRFETNSHVKVARKAASGTTTLLTEGADYTLTGGPTAGTITLTTALAAASGDDPAEKLSVYRERPLTQQTGFGVNSAYRSPVHEAAFDEARQIDQDLDLKISRALQLPATEDTSMVLPPKETRAGALLGFNASGVPIAIDPDTLTALDDDEPLGVIPVSGGGTGGITAAEARTNLGVGTIGTLSALLDTHISTPHAGISHAALISADLVANNAARLRDLGIWVVESATLATAPAVVNGNAYLIPSDATGTWAAQVGKIAYGESSAWTYKTPAKGWNAIAKDTDAEWYYDGSAWAVTTGSGSVVADDDLASSTDARVVGLGTTHKQGGGARFRVHWTADGRIVVYGDQAAFGFDPAGDSWAPYELHIPWDRSTVEIEAVYVGINYILVQTDQETGNLWHMGSSAHGQGGMGGTTAATTLTRIQKFVDDAVKITAVYTEANLNAIAFWFAKTSGGNLYSCGYSGSEHVMGYNSTTNLTTPRKMTYSDGTTPVANVDSVSCSSLYAPVWCLLTTGVALRWGAGTDGAHGGNSTSALTWPAALETSPGSGIARTDIEQIVTTGSNISTLRAVTWILTSAGKIESSGSRYHGNGDGAALTSAAVNTFQPAAGTIDTLTVASIHGGGGENPLCIAITSTGTGYMAGYIASFGQLGTGSTTNIHTFTALGTLPSGFSGALTGARIFGAGSSAQVTAYLEATISSAKYVASIGCDTSYATAKGTTGVAAGSQTWGLVLGTRGTLESWNVAGDATVFGIEMLNDDGELRYAGGNDQGQGGVQFGNLHSVPILQPCRLSGPRMVKPLTWLGAYSAGTAYTPRDVVEHDGSSWTNVSASTGVAPPTLPTESNSNWELLAKRGDSAVGISWEGQWTTATAYTVDDGVHNDGSAYICILGHTSGASTEPGTGASWQTYWDILALAGEVTGPASSVDGNITLFNGTTGKAIKDSGISLRNALGVYNVKLYGTAGGGADSTAAVLAAIAAAKAAGGGVIFFPFDTYGLTSTATVDFDRCIIAGQGSRINVSNAVNAFVFDECADVGVQDIQIWGPTGPTSGIGIDFVNCTRVYNRALDLRAFFQGIRVQGGSEMFFDFFTIGGGVWGSVATGSYLLKLMEHASSGAIPREVFFDGGWNVKGAGAGVCYLDNAIVIEACDGLFAQGGHCGFADNADLLFKATGADTHIVNVNFNGTLFDGNAGNGGWGAKTEGSSGGVMREINFPGCHFVGHSECGVEMGLAVMAHLNFPGCFYTSNAKWGAKFTAGSHITLACSKFYDNNSGGSGVGHLHVDGITNFVAAVGTFASGSTPAAFGIEIGAGSNDQFTLGLLNFTGCTTDIQINSVIDDLKRWGNSTDKSDTIASASPLVIPNVGNTFHVSGTTSFSGVSIPYSVGEEYTLIFDGALTITAGATLDVKSTIVTQANAIVKFVTDGTVLRETARSGIAAVPATTIELGHASDTTLSRSSAGIMAVEGETVHTNSISRTVTAAGIELGHATDTTITRTGAGAIAVEGVGVALNSTSLAHTAGTVELGHASDTTLSRSSAGVMAVEGETVHTNSISRTVTALGIELGHATDTTVTRAAAGIIAVEGVQLKSAGKETIFLPAAAMTARTTNGAASGTTELATNDVMLRSFDFDTTTEEGVGFMVAMPKSWNESTVTFKAFWTAASGSGGVAWGLAAYAFSDDDAMDTAVSGQQVVTDTLLTANDMHITAESSAITIGGTPAEGDVIYFELTREVANGSDTIAADAKLIGIHLYITTNAATDA